MEQTLKMKKTQRPVKFFSTVLFSYAQKFTLQISDIVKLVLVFYLKIVRVRIPSVREWLQRFLPFQRQEGMLALL